jgi:hypothetical protein
VGFGPGAVEEGILGVEPKVGHVSM